MNLLLLCGGMVFVAACGPVVAAADASGDGYSGACSMRTCVHHAFLLTPQKKELAEMKVFGSRWWWWGMAQICVVHPGDGAAA